MPVLQGTVSTPSMLESLLSTNLLRSLVLNLGYKTNMLHSAAQAAMTALLKACEGRPDRAAAAVVTLLGRGHPNFDKRTVREFVGAVVCVPACARPRECILNVRLVSAGYTSCCDARWLP
jgi:hypothetical protein